MLIKTRYRIGIGATYHDSLGTTTTIGQASLLLAVVVGGDREGHELFQDQGALGIEVQQARRDGRQAKPLPDHGGGDEEARGDVLLAQPGLAHDLESTELSL